MTPATSAEIDPLELLEGFRLAADAPRILLYASERCAWIARKVARFIELTGGQLLPKWQRKRLAKRRPERLEAVVLVCRALLKHCDLLSLRIGKPRGRVPEDYSAEADVRYVNPPGQARLCEETGLSITRLRRAIAELRRAGYLCGPGKGSALKQRRIEYVNSKGVTCWSACRVVYAFTRLFFERLHLDQRLEREQADAYTRARGPRIYSGALLAAREHRRNWKAGSREQRPPGAPGTPTPAAAPATARATEPGSEDAARALIAVQLALREAHPDWTLERVRAEARELEKPPPGS